MIGENASWIEVSIVIVAFIGTLVSLVLVSMYLVDAVHIWDMNVNGEIRRAVRRNLRNEALRLYMSAGFLLIGGMYMGVPPAQVQTTATAQVTAGVLILTWCPLLVIWSALNLWDRLKAWEYAQPDQQKIKGGF